MLALLPAALAVALASAAATPPAPAYYWRWSDGSRVMSRTFADSAVGDVLPTVVVSMRPAAAGHRAVLQFRDEDRWRTEDAAATDASGSATLQLNPYCADGGWCDTAMDYRIVIDGEVARLRVTYDG